MLFAYVPYLYFLHTRLKGKAQRVSWFIVYFLPIGMFYYFYNQLSLLALLVMYYLVNLVYENGYIQNDVLTTRKELNPTLRLTVDESRSIYKNVKYVFWVRGIIAAVLLFFLFFLVESDIFYIFFGLLIFLQLLYLLYNSVRSRLNFYLILPLSYIRFYAPFLALWFYTEEYMVLILSIFLYPFSKLLEFTRQPRYKFIYLAILVGNVDRFRVFYYLCFVLVSLVFYTSGFYEVFPLLTVSLFYLAYRLLGYFLIQRSERVKSLVNSGAKKVYRE
jgi:hypothetical protein